MEIIDKIVEYNNYCKTCKYKEYPQDTDPCNDCLSYPINTNSRKPIRYIKEDIKEINIKEKKGKKK